MIIQTRGQGTFGNFYDLCVHMELYQLREIELVRVEYWGADLSFTAGVYTYEQILQILGRR